MSNYILTQVYILFPFAFKGPIFIMDAGWKNENKKKGGKRPNTNYLGSTEKKLRLTGFANSKIYTSQRKPSFLLGWGESKQAVLWHRLALNSSSICLSLMC